ncbi:AraC family transcriptional regulator [Stella sp.]|uniref:AraC family transcriptional regulator n=1 Tax=Stella sp. TaxID=2912054 RepID=UPI0035B4952A
MAGGGASATIASGPGTPGIERLAVRLVGRAYAPHRHDTYAVGWTVAGIQSFRYRGEARVCLPGQYHVLHPDELHDGRPGTAEGFAYRIAYIDPALIQAALGGRPLPFVPGGVLDGRTARLPADLWRLDRPLAGLAGVEAVAAVADMLVAAAGDPAPPPRPLPLAALDRVRRALADDPARPFSAAELERIAGLDRWTLARRFREAYGTSPSRFRTMRQLDRARAAIRSGLPLAEAAAASGFADQSHLTRQFKRAYGMTPGMWAGALG